MTEHGSNATYMRGCHCPACTDAHAAYLRSWRAGRRGGPDVELAVTCWCQKAIVGVPRRELLAGLTRACGASECKQMDKTAREAKESA